MPNYPFNSLEDESFEAKILNQQVQEAIYIASPVLYAELQKYLAGTIFDKEEKQRIESTLYRYISRMSSRCTPFGLFAGCSVGYVNGDKTHIASGNFNRHTRLDMYFLCTLSQELSKQPDIKKSIRYYPNTTLYPLGKNYRYVEYWYMKSRRVHQISSVEYSIYLNAILKKTKKGALIEDLISYLTRDKIKRDEAQKFIDELIDSQIIVSELSPSVTGDGFFTQLIYILEKAGINNSLTESIKEIRQTLYRLDSNQGDNMELYQSIINKIKEINIPYEEKFLFQVDMVRNDRDTTLGNDVVNELQKVMTFLNKITPKIKNEALEKFQEAFYNRYEDRKIPLMEALDSEIGIGYPVNNGFGNISPLLENFHIPNRVNQGISFQSNVFLSVLFKKVMDTLKQNEKEIILCDDDVKNFTAYWDDLPPTLYSMFELLKSASDNSLIHLNGFYGPCGANLLGRFAYMDESIVRFVDEVAAKEQELMPDVLFAEIAHLPDSRVGNILSRPHVRDYEILYLANSDLPEKQLIYMSDLYLSIRQGKICLRSKRLNKDIIPRLTNAHNYYNNPMPIYRFLCDMQVQHGRSGLFFNWGYLNNELDFLPRVRYRNVILSAAAWKIPTEEMKHLFAIKEDDQLIAETKKWCQKYELPQMTLLPDGDNELFVDWENVRSIRALFSIIKKRQTLFLKEFLYDYRNSIVRDKDGNPYINECIIAFYKDKKK
jgi:hypothetical protein